MDVLRHHHLDIHRTNDVFYVMDYNIRSKNVPDTSWCFSKSSQKPDFMSLTLLDPGFLGLEYPGVGGGGGWI